MVLLYGSEFVVIKGEAMAEKLSMVEREGVQVFRELGVGVGWVERVGTGLTYCCDISVP